MQMEQRRLPEAGIIAVAFDEDGFFLDPDHWNEGLAEELALAAEIGPLTQQHWQTIHYIRERYLRSGGMPLMRHVCRHLGLRPHAVKGLFGGCRQLWRIAGLPNPGEEAKAYMD